VTCVTESDPSIRSFLLSEVLQFVERARTCPGVRRIALLGSLASTKRDPKDADVLVMVDDDAGLASLAIAARRLKGRAQSRNKGADILLVDTSARASAWRVTLATAAAVPFCTTISTT